MAAFRFSRRAESDLLRIIDYTRGAWGEAQRARYVDALEACCARLADTPGLGRRCDDVRPGLMRLEQGKHVIFYREAPYGVRVVTILHERMLPENHLADTDDDDE